MQFYEIDLPHASIIKQKLVQKVLPDTDKVSQVVLVTAVLTSRVLHTTRSTLPYVITKTYCLHLHHMPA